MRTTVAQDVRVLFEGPNVAHLATLLPDGAPHAVPVWVDMEGDRIAFLTSPGSRKARNIAQEPRVAFSITRKDTPYVSAHVRGRVVGRLEGDDAWAVIDRISAKYTGGPYPLRADRVVFLVEPTHAVAQTFG